MTDTEKLLRDLVALPSVNPAFAPANDPLAGEQKVAEFLAATCAHAGLDVEFQPVLPGRSNILAILRPTGRVKQRILLAPHMDIVPGTSAVQYLPRIQGGRLYGRGACDTKGSVAAMLSALCALAAQGPRPAATEIVFAGLVDEESAQAGSRALAASGFKADLAIVGEPTRLQIVTAHKGSLWLGMQTRGKAAHGARPDLGRNAVHEMARAVDLLETVYSRRLRQRRHPVLGHATVNVGVISGGTQPNIVPDACRIKVDRRTLPGETLKSVRAELLTLFRAKKLNVQITDQKQAPCLPMETNPDLPLVQQLFAHAGQKKAVGVDYFCDASVLSAAGIPSVVFGPGDIAQAHTADEWISLRSLADATALLTKFLRSLP
jgi:acetylornithine deacetylase